LDAFDQQDVAFSAAVANELSLCIENVRLQQELIQNERMAAIGLTMSNLAHNMKNLLALNQNAVDLLKLQLKELQNEKINKSWSYIQQSFTRIHNLTVNMLAFAKEQDIVLRPVSINKVILSNRDAIEQSLESKGIELALDLNPDIPPWMMDTNQFQRILLNLLVNAIDAVKGKPNAKITIATQLDNDDRLKVTISDNGCGIAADRQEKIFDLFFTTKGSGGSGLGLPMVKKFVEKMGGSLTLQSAPDAGATFIMSFPRKTAPVGDPASSDPDDSQ
jgi:signal transduction histidine kinase